MSLCRWDLLKGGGGDRAWWGMGGCGGVGGWGRRYGHWNDQSPDHKVRLINSFEASVHSGRREREMEVMMQEAQSVPIAHQSASPVAFLDITLKDSCLLPHKYVPRASSGVNVINALLRNGCHIKCRRRERRQVNEVESLHIRAQAEFLPSEGRGWWRRSLFVWFVLGKRHCRKIDHGQTETISLWIFPSQSIYLRSTWENLSDDQNMFVYWKPTNNFSASLDTWGFLTLLCHRVPNQVNRLHWKTVINVLLLLPVTQPVKLEKGHV